MKLSWGLTIHKSQILTLEKTTINIGKKERQGVRFVVISRVKYLNGLKFQPPFSYHQYEKMEKVVGVTMRKAEEEIKIDHKVNYLSLTRFTLFIFPWSPRQYG